MRYNDAVSKYRGFTPFCNLFACPHSCDLGPFYALFLLFFGGGGVVISIMTIDNDENSIPVHVKQIKCTGIQRMELP